MVVAMGSTSNTKILIPILLQIICKIPFFDAVPVIVEVIDFKDPWEYKLEPHNDPLLKQSSQLHTLPPLGRRMAKYEDIESEEILKNSLEELGGLAEESLRSRLTCSACRLGVTLLRAQILKNEPMDKVREKFVSVCVGLNIETEIVCGGVFDIYGPVVLPSLKITTLESEKICSLLLGEICGLVDNPTHDWVIELPEKNQSSLNKKEIYAINSDTPAFKVLHISDTHYDPQYEEGSPANCEEPLCCRSYSTRATKGNSIPAGKWGSYGKCDAPEILILNMLKNIASQHPDIDYIIWTGDIPPHDIWNQTKTQNIDNIKFSTDKIYEAFPNIPIFPTLGNHEGIPAGNFPPPWMKQENQSIAWLYSEIASEWSKWLPSSANTTLLHGGFYSVLIRPGFRLISLNTNYCHALSWWLVLNSTDPAKELEWLVYELQQAENKGEKVHIIGHIPPGGSDCLKVWSHNYYDIINRYEDTVVAQFFGHTHFDEFEVFYDNVELTRPSSIAFIGPSVTTFEKLNPGYRIYYVDGDHEHTTREVLDHETWIMDLSKANANPDDDPEWYMLYSARLAFGMNSMRPEEWSKLVDKMLEDQKLFDKFYRYYYKGSIVRPPCDTNKCKFEILCDLRNGRSHDRHRLCQNLEEVLKPEEKN